VSSSGYDELIEARAKEDAYRREQDPEGKGFARILWRGEGSSEYDLLPAALRPNGLKYYHGPHILDPIQKKGFVNRLLRRKGGPKPIYQFEHLAAEHDLVYKLDVDDLKIERGFPNLNGMSPWDFFLGMPKSKERDERFNAFMEEYFPYGLHEKNITKQ